MTIIIEKATIKMKNLLKYILLLIYVALMPACGEDSGLDGVFANKPFALVTAADGGRTSISAVIDDGKRTIRLTFDKKRDVDAVELTFQLNPGYAMVSPKEPETTMDLTQPRTVTVSSGAGEVSYEISANYLFFNFQAARFVFGLVDIDKGDKDGFVPDHDDLCFGISGGAVGCRTAGYHAFRRLSADKRKGFVRPFDRGEFFRLQRPQYVHL